jgi:glycosyltransferase involved in cell wall biosynthesis
MLIAIDARESGTSTGRYIDKLIENIAKINTDYDFNIITKPDRVEYFKKIAPKFYVYETNIKEFTFSEQLNFLKLLKQVDADLVHFGMVQQPVLYKGKVVTTIHDLTTIRFNNPSKNLIVFKAKQQIYKWVIKKAAIKSRAIITPSEFVKNDVMKFTNQPANKFFVTYEAADKIKEKAEVIKKLTDKRFLMYVGRPTTHKNLERLIESFELLKIKYPDLYLVLAGKKDFNYQQIENKVKQKGIKNVYFTGYITESQLRWLYENCLVYVFPSLSEGFGLPGIEAMIHGAPVASSKATCLPEIYGDAAEYFNPLDIDDMANNIIKIIEDRKLKDELIKKGYVQAKRYSWQKMAEQTLSIYDKVLKG